MPFKINVANKGKTFKLESESEAIVGKKIGDTIKGEDIDAKLAGYELEITGTSDNSGHPGKKGNEGTAYTRKVLTYGPGMHDRRKGIRLRRLQRGEEISLKIVQVNTKVIKEGSTKFEALGEEPAAEETPAEEKKSE